MKTTPTFREHVKGCADCKAGTPCATGKKFLATMDNDGDEQLTASAAASEVEAVNGILPTNVQWMPPGKQIVQPLGFDEPFEMRVTPAIASSADRQLQQLRAKAAAGQDAEPYGDFNHKDEGRAFKAKRFFWGGDDPKEGGVRMEVDWTPAGAKSVLDGALCCISPQWFLSKATKAFLGLSHNVGGLVPRSAFHSIQAFAKADSSKPNQNQNMTTEDKSEIAKLIADAIAANNTTLEAKAKSAQTPPAAPDLAQVVAAALKPVTDKITEFETIQKDARIASAKAAVQVHVVRGAIAPEDTAAVKFWEDSYLASASAAEAILAKLPGKQVARIIRGNGGQITGTVGATPEDRVIAAAKSLREKQPADFKSDAEAVEAYLRTPQGQAEYSAFRETIPVAKQ